jgi:short-subunit dehydrogenase
MCVKEGFDVVAAADDPAIWQAAEHLRQGDVQVQAIECDLATTKGVDQLYAAAQSSGRPVEALLANAGHGLGHAFLNQSFEDVLHVVNTNITGALYLTQRIAKDMRARRRGRILFTGSIAGFMPGAFQAVYNGSKAFIDSFALALRNELKDDNVTVTCLMPGVTDTEFFERADLMDTKVGQDEHKANPADVAKTGFEAMMRGEASVVHGMGNKMRVAMSKMMPQTALAEQHRKMAEPNSGKDGRGS